MNKLDSTTVIQVGLIVRDAAKTAAHYAEVFGIPTPEVVPICSDEFAHTHYLGKPAAAQGRAAYFNMGPVQVELIEPVGSPSAYEEFLRVHGEGIHHIAFRTEDMQGSQAFLGSKGMQVIQSGGWEGGQYAFIDCISQLGMILELLHFDRKD